jgi:hypothetical protein
MPLHFAAAVGYTNVFCSSMLHEARADRAHKHRVNLEMSARHSEIERTAEVLRELLSDKDGELSDVEGEGEQRRGSRGMAPRKNPLKMM